MAARLNFSIRKLINALNANGYKLTYNTKEFVGTEGNIHKLYSLNVATWNSEKGRYDHDELYHTTSQVRMVLYLRDMWFKHNGWELPEDQEMWNKIRKSLQEKGDL